MPGVRIKFSLFWKSSHGRSQSTRLVNQWRQVVVGFKSDVILALTLKLIFLHVRQGFTNILNEYCVIFRKSLKQSTISSIYWTLSKKINDVE